MKRVLRTGAVVTPPWIAVLVLLEHVPSAATRLVSRDGADA